MDTLIQWHSHYNTTAFSFYLSNLNATDLCLGQCWSPGKLRLGSWAHTSPVRWHRGLHRRLLPVAHTCLEADSPEPRCCHCSKCTKNKPKHPTLYITQSHMNLLHSVNIFSSTSEKNSEENNFYYLYSQRNQVLRERKEKRRMKYIHSKYEESWLRVHLQIHSALQTQSSARRQSPVAKRSL